jgi:Leucine-rich repeat (LRR) protein
MTTVTVYAEDRLDWRSLHRYRPTAGLGYEKRAWTMGVEGWAEHVGGWALRHRWRALESAAEQTWLSSLPIPPDFVPPARLAFSGPGELDLLHALLGEEGAFCVRRVVKLDGSRRALAAGLLTKDPTESLVAAEPPVESVAHSRDHADLSSSDLLTFTQALQQFRWMVTSLASARFAVPGWVLYGGSDLRELVIVAAREAGVSLQFVDLEPHGVTAALPTWGDLPSEGDSVDWTGFNLATLPARSEATELILDDTAVVDLEPLRGWQELQSLSLRKLSPRSLAPIPTSKLQRLVVDGSDGPRLQQLGPAPLRSLVVEHGERDNLHELRSFSRLRALELQLTRLGSWDGLEALQQLESLTLDLVEMPEQLDVLARLPALSSIRLRFRGSFDASALPDLPSLRHLELRGAYGGHLLHPSSLVRFGALQALSLPFTDLAEASWLAPLRELRSLNLQGTAVRSCEILAQLPELQLLDLGLSEVADLQPLQKLQRLRSLDVSSTPALEDFEVESLCTELEVLRVDGLQRSDLTCLSRFSHLLELWRLELRSFRGVQELAHLERLEPVGAELTDVSPLADHPSLRALSAGGKGAMDICPLATLAHLEELTLHSATLSDLSPVGGLAQLRNLCLSRMQLPDLDALGALPLQTLELRESSFPDPAPLGSLQTLRSLDASRSSLRTSAPLAHLSQLRSLKLGHLGPELEARPLLTMRPLAELEVSRESIRGLEAQLRLRHHMTILEGSQG